MRRTGVAEPTAEPPPSGHLPAGELAAARVARVELLVAEAQQVLEHLELADPMSRMLRTAIVRRDGVLLEAVLREIRNRAG